MWTTEDNPRVTSHFHVFSLDEPTRFSGWGSKKSPLVALAREKEKQPLFNLPSLFSTTKLYSLGKTTSPDTNTETLSQLRDFLRGGISILLEMVPDFLSHLRGKKSSTGYRVSTKQIWNTTAREWRRGSAGENYSHRDGQKHLKRPPSKTRVC